MHIICLLAFVGHTSADPPHSLPPPVSQTINLLGKKAKDGTLSIDEMAGGTFTISNGGVFGSVLSTPIINPPQSAILGMHATNLRPAVVNGQILPRWEGARRLVGGVGGTPAWRWGGRCDPRGGGALGASDGAVCSCARSSCALSLCQVIMCCRCGIYTAATTAQLPVLLLPLNLHPPGAAC